MQLTCLTVKDDSWGRYVKPGQRLFVLHSTFHERQIPKDAAFRWNPDKKKWWTDDPDKAAKLAEWADWSCQEELHAIRRENNNLINLSRSADANIDIPAPEGCEYLGYQKAGVQYALERFGIPIPKGCIGMGIGKEGGDANRCIREDAGSGKKDDGLPCNGAGGFHKAEGCEETEGKCKVLGVAQDGRAKDSGEDAEPRNKGEAFEGPKAGASNSWVQLQRGERAASDENCDDIRKGFVANRVCEGVSNKDPWSQDQSQSPNKLQSGLWEPKHDGGNRVGREKTRISETKDAGREKGRCAEKPRVESGKNNTQLRKEVQTPSRGVLIADEMG